jgi:hypothetical protein
MSKRFTKKLQNLGQQAAKIRQVVEAAPEKAAQLRDVVTLTTTQLQQLKTELQAGIAGLRAESGDRLLIALREIHADRPVLLEAGFELAGVDLDLAANQRLTLYLSRIEEVSTATLRSLREAHQQQHTLHGLLTAILEAQELASRVDLRDLTFNELEIHVGPIPTARVCWRSAVPEDSPVPPVLATKATPSLAPFASQGSFFGPHPQTIQPAPPAMPAATSPKVETPSSPAAPAAPVSTPPEPGSDWRRGALDRFKKMPDVSKYRR